MARERTNTAGKLALIPEGTRQFMVAGEIKKKYVGPNKDMEMFIVPLQFKEGIGDQAFLASMMGPFLKAMGSKEIAPGVYDWDTTEFEGKSFQATVTHKADKNDSSKIRAGMGDIKTVEGIPF